MARSSFSSLAVYAECEIEILEYRVRVEARENVADQRCELPEPGVGDREEWGREQSVQRLLGEAFELRFEDGELDFVGSSGEEIWERQLSGAGPVRQLYESFNDERRRELRGAAIAYFESERDGDEIRAPGPYLLILGSRR